MLTVGVCGGFTTLSTFSLQNVSLLHEGKVGMAALYILSTVAVCVILAWLGYKAGQPR